MLATPTPTTLNPQKVFFLDVRHDVFLNGGERKVYRSIAKFFLAAAAVLGGLGLLLGAIGGLLLATEVGVQQALDDHGVSVDASVIDRYEGQRTDSKGNPAGTTYNVVYQFRADGELVTHTRAINQELYEQYDKGDLIPIRYLPENTRISRVVGSRDDLPPYVTGLGLVLLAAGLICLLAGLRERGRNRRLVHDGVVLPGRILKAEGQRTRSGYQIHVKYTFTTPAGKQLTRKAVGVRNDWWNKPMPVQGTQLAVLYVDDGLVYVL